MSLAFGSRTIKSEIFGRPVSLSVPVLVGGCCWDDGVRRLAVDIGCSKIGLIRSPRQTWVEFPANDGRTSLWEWLFIWEDGTIDVYGELDEAAILPDPRDFCTKTVDLTYNYYVRENYGNHDFTPGEYTMNLRFPNLSNSNISFLSAYTYNLEYPATVWSCGVKIEGEDWAMFIKKSATENMTHLILYMMGPIT